MKRKAAIMKNLEIKVKLINRGKTEKAIRQLGCEKHAVLHQEDSYFKIPKGRLKVRRFDDNHGELISYQRKEDGKSERWSEWQAYPLKAPNEMTRLLKSALGVYGVVKKERTLYIFNHTRIHLDRVEHLGDFLELEAKAVNSEEKARQDFNFLSNKLELNKQEQILCSYIDLLNQKKGDGR